MKMQEKTGVELRQEIKYIKLARERDELTNQGISTAIEGGELVTIGDIYCDYMDWQEFMLNQIVNLGSNAFCQKYHWTKADLIEALREYDEADWQTVGEEEFAGIAA